MSVNFEQIVRPFQTPDIAPPRQPAITTTEDIESPGSPVSLTPGLVGTTKIYQGFVSVQMDGYVDHKQRESRAEAS